MQKSILQVTERIAHRSQATRQQFEDIIRKARMAGVSRRELPCGNFAHGIAACDAEQKDLLAKTGAVNLGIVTAYNDMLSAHQPYATYPDQIKATAKAQGASAQVAGGVPAMCDGITQGMPGMELSLMSRDVVAMSTAIALSHDMFDAALMLGICDKIVPGLLIGALSFGHLPVTFIPAGPMPSGMSNPEKAKFRQAFAKGEIDKDKMLEVESAAYHSPGTCTFYGTANSNQMLMEIMGLQLPTSSFVNPDDPLRPLLTCEAVKQTIKAAEDKTHCLAEIMTTNTLVNGLVGLLATGGSTNHLIHLVAIARAAGILIDWQDIADLSKVVPLLCRIYPNGQADINHFHQAGGMGFLIQSLLAAGVLHEEVTTVLGKTGLSPYAQTARCKDGKLAYAASPKKSLNDAVLTDVQSPFQVTGGLQLLTGNLGRSVIKLSAVESAYRQLEAPAKVFESQEALKIAFEKGECEMDFFAVVRFQGPKANGMPELHKLMTILGALQDQGYRVALVTDGRLSGASGKVPSAIHMTPEALDGGLIAKIQDGDILSMDAEQGELNVLVDDRELQEREVACPDLASNDTGMGRELFTSLRNKLTCAEFGGSFLGNLKGDTE
ncbi:MAG: phosphogluconate dehydratase [Cellvibrionales bacterium]|nr:phosphogluconate dehydratase [Cellvibrionales bacterium]